MRQTDPQHEDQRIAWESYCDALAAEERRKWAEKRMEVAHQRFVRALSRAHNMMEV